jgi:predicted Zn-dependent protease
MAARFALAIAAVLFCLGPAVGAEQTPTPTAQTEQAASPAQPELTPEEKRDADIGKSAAEELEKEFKVAADSPELPRITAIVEAIRPVTQKPGQTYQIKVLEDKALNALSLPGGYLYFTQGLIRAVESDDELAAVAAHEMAHICLSHSRRLMSRDERYQMILGSVLLASILSNSEALNPGAVASVGSLVAQDALNHYGREAEQEADHQAVLYLKATGKHNPVAMLTVVEGLARMESSEGNPELGIQKTHPYGKERVEAVSRELEGLGVPIERRRVIHSLVADASAVNNNDSEIGELRLNGRVVFQPAVALDGASPVARAQQSADLLNKLLLANLQLLEVTTADDGDAVDLVARGQVFATITPEDAAFHQNEVEALAEKAMAAIRLGFSEERVRRAY